MELFLLNLKSKKKCLDQDFPDVRIFKIMLLNYHIFIGQLTFWIEYFLKLQSLALKLISKQLRSPLTLSGKSAPSCKS